MILAFTEEQIAMLKVAMAYYMLKSFPFKGGSHSERKAWQTLGVKTWQRLNQYERETPSPS